MCFDNLFPAEKSLALIISCQENQKGLGAVHKRRHQSRVEGCLPKDDFANKAYLVKVTTSFMNGPFVKITVF